MNYTTRDLQARTNAILGYGALDVDGMKGPNTRKFVAEAMRLKRVKHEKDIFHDSGLHRIHWHWTASTYTVTPDDLKHYNDVHDYQGNSYDGAARAEHQANYDWRKGVGVSHTLNANTGAIGQSVAAMQGAEGWPKVKWGNYPLTWAGIDAMLDRSIHYSKTFDIPVTPWSTLSHAEIQQTLGIRQNNKWDYMILPDMDVVMDAVECGNILRARMLERM
ncbi:endolysin [Sulfitobacter phage phiCB2047-B]|uniref:Uncharacterized protein n=1 Tax=Sulfitobacter phage phiCB2047-B TaxID=754046 RepID=M4PYF5_9CAUD|nr:endolysin [Sulfitobacter phage phiCB2047-B]AGH07379.1 hypothetical protein SUFG_00006 [Sulfitobacter phage phiCB2047-B]